MSAAGLTANGKYRKIDSNYAGKKIKILGLVPDYWALHPTTGLCTRLLGFSPDYWALHPTTGLCTRHTRVLGHGFWKIQVFGALNLKGLRPLPPTPADSRTCGFLDFSENVDFLNFPAGFGVWEFAIDWKWLWASNGRILNSFRPISVHFRRFSRFRSFWRRFRWSDAVPGRSQDRLEVP